jgi:hypothetical protein
MNAVVALLLALGLEHDRPDSVKLGPGPLNDSGRYFPRVEGTNLEGRKFTLPADFEAKYNVVVIAFRREQQADVDGWLPFLKQLNVTKRDIRVYELPTLRRSYRPVRRFIDGGMARGIPERATREATITLYIDKTPFKRALAIATEDQIITLLVARDGRVLWHADGRFDASAASGLESLLESLEAHDTGSALSR